MTTPWRTVRVFISSTFKDMQSERDHLVRFVFPRLRDELLQRRIHLVDVDLRWGVTSDQDASEVCREIVDECRPRFLCMLGGRYGWVPPGKVRSITADEVYYGVLDRVGRHGHAFFYFRDPGATAAMVEERAGEFREPPGSPNERRLAELKEAIGKLSFGSFTYPAEWDGHHGRLAGLTQFGQRVYADLLASIDAEFGAQAAPKLDEFAEENAAMEAFAEERSQRFVLGSRETVWNELLRHAEGTGGNGSLCLTGTSGSGKSALLAKFAQALQSTASSLIVCHFVGASPSSTDGRRTLRRLCHELIQGAGLTAEIPDDPEKLRTAFSELLKQSCEKHRVMLLLDAVNQFDPGSSDLSWLPEELPQNARIILTTLPGPALDDLRRRRIPPREVTLPPLTAGDADAIIDEFLKRYRKSVTPEQKAMLRAKADAVMPLYLLAALEELRTLGSYEEITGRIRELPETTLALFAWILKRLEDDPGFRDADGRLVGVELVGGFSAYFAASQHGMSQSELVDLLDPGDPQGNVAALLQLLQPYLMRRGELLDFYHGQFRSAAEQVYLQTDAQRHRAHDVLADFFRSLADPGNDQRWKGENARPFVELPFHLARSDAEELHELLWNPRWHRAKLKHTDVYGLVSDLALIPEDRELRLVRNAVSLSANALVRDEKQYASQMVGRLLTREEPRIQSLLKEIANTQGSPWLRPLGPALTPPGGPLMCTLEGHTGSVEAVALSPNGRRAVSASSDGTLKLWDLETAREIRTLKGHTGPVRGVAVSPDGRQAVSASSDKTLRVWDLETGRELRTLKGHSGPVRSVAASPDGRRVVSVSSDKTLKVWDLNSGTEIRTLEGHAGDIYGVAVSPDGRHAVSASSDGALKLWDLETAREIRTLEGHSGPVRGVAVSPDGRRAVSASDDDTLKVWDLETGRTLRTVEGHVGDIRSVAVTLDGRYAVSASTDHTLKVWDLETGCAVRTLEGHSDYVVGVAISPDGRRAVSASWDHTLKVWDLETGRELRTFEGHSGSVEALAVSPDGRRGVSASWDHTLKVWDLQTGRALLTLEGHSDSVHGVAVCKDGRRVVSASSDKTLKVWDLISGSELRTLEDGHFDPVFSVAVTPDGRRAVSGSADRTLKVWDLQTGRDIRTLKGHSGWVVGAAVSPDGGQVVSASADHTLKVWDLETGRELLTLEGHSDSVDGVAVSPDGRWVVSASVDRTVKVWNLETGDEIRTLKGHAARVVDVAVSPDGGRAISASKDWTVKVWDLERGAPTATFTCDGPALCCAFADDHKLLAGDELGHVHFLYLDEPNGPPADATGPHPETGTNRGVPLEYQAAGKPRQTLPWWGRLRKKRL
jgi:WD40 repeat protein